MCVADWFSKANSHLRKLNYFWLAEVLQIGQVRRLSAAIFNLLRMKSMDLKDKAFIVGAYEHPTRKAPDKSVAQLHAESAKGALEDAGLSHSDIDGYFCAGDAPGLGMLSMADYMGLRNLRHIDSTETGGSSYLIHVSHAAQAIAMGRCDIALISSGVTPACSNARGPDMRAADHVKSTSPPN